VSQHQPRQYQSCAEPIPPIPLSLESGVHSGSLPASASSRALGRSKSWTACPHSSRPWSAENLTWAMVSSMLYRLLAIHICTFVLAASALSAPLVFEAESAVRLEGVFGFVRDAATGGELGLQVREGVGTDFSEDQAGELRRKEMRVGFDADEGKAVYRFHVPETGDYWVWARTYWLWECSNSFWIGGDANSSTILTDKVYNRWHWVRARAPVKLASGTAPFTISNREDGIRIDQFCLTRDRHFRPKGILEANVLVPRAETPPPLFLCAIAGAPLVFPESQTPLVLWVRNAAGHRRTATVSAHCDEALSLTMPESLTVELPARSGLVDVAFRVSNRAGHPLQCSQVNFSVQSGQGEPVTASYEFVHALLWEAAGPFRTNSTIRPRPPVWGGETGAAPVPVPSVLGSLAWVPIAEPDLLTGAGRIDLRRVLSGHARSCWAYLRTVLDWPRDEVLPVELRSDDQSIVWVNGVFAAAHPVIGPGERYHTRCTLPLKRGPNTVLVAVNQVQAFWEVSLMPATWRQFPAPCRP